jgi:heme/copper-type cytochrome/quinol oxidase subunit 1
MLFALGFLPMFGIGGLTGLPLGSPPPTSTCTTPTT